MAPPYRKKLIEVSLPLKAINIASAREKSIRHGHPSTLHLWWARRPLAACRAVLFASLVDDPSDDPEANKLSGETREHWIGTERNRLHQIIEELVLWENSNNPVVINKARAEIARCVASRKIELGEWKKSDRYVYTIKEPVWKAAFGHTKANDSGETEPKSVIFNDFLTRTADAEAVNAFLAEHAPPVLDPFCGGGSIPLEAQRLGLRAHASDLNPVAVLITKALIEIPPKFAGMPPVNPESRISQQPTHSHVGDNFSNQSDSELPIDLDSAPRRTKKPRKSAKTTALPGMNAWRGAQGLAEDVRYYGKWMRDEAEKRIGHLYPKVKITEEMAEDRPDLKDYVGQELTVIAWLWARTVASPNPACGGAHVPLVKSFWLSTKKGKETYIIPKIKSDKFDYQFEVVCGNPPSEFNPNQGTVVRKGAKCILTETPISFDYIREEGKSNRMKSRMMAIVVEGNNTRLYINPQDEHIKIANSANPIDYPDTDLPNQALGFRVMLYGMNKHYKLFTPRQLVVLTTFSDLVGEAREKVLADAKNALTSNPQIHLSAQESAEPQTKTVDDRPLEEGGLGPVAYADAVATYLAFVIEKALDRCSTICTWDSSPKMEALRSTFARQAIPMTWDFAEGNTFSDSSGNWNKNIDWVCLVLNELFSTIIGIVNQSNSNTPDFIKDSLKSSQISGCLKLNNTSNANYCVVSSDPPYYDNIGYADLSDFFYVWVRRSLKGLYYNLLSTSLTPKTQELIASPYRHNGNKRDAQMFFENGITGAFSCIHKFHTFDYPLTVVYGYKQMQEDNDLLIEEFEESIQTLDIDSIKRSYTTASTGWETMLSSLILAGFSITGTWPMRTEMATRMIGLGSNSLASSIILVCRPRPENAPIASRKDFMNSLRQELPEALKNLQQGNIAPVDLAQASIGPGMGVFTRYAKVIESNGSPMTVRTALGIINQVLDEVLAEQEGDFDADTRWALAWFDQFGAGEGPFGVAETLSRAKNTAVNGLVEAGIVKASKGKVQLLSRSELPDQWNPSQDKRLTVWESAQHLIKALESKGESEAAALLNQLGGIGETARELAYRLYSICERKKWAEEALAYNALVIAWPEISKLARAARTSGPKDKQGEFF
jgi:putative DNA methylase